MRKLLLTTALALAPFAAGATVVPSYCGPLNEGSATQGGCEAAGEVKVFLNNAKDVLSATGNVGKNNVGIPTVTILSDNNQALNMFFDTAGGFATITPGGKKQTEFAGITFVIQPGYAFTNLSFDIQLDPAGNAPAVLEKFTVQGLLNGNLIAPIGNEQDAADTDKEFAIGLTGGIMNAVNIFSLKGFNEIKHIEIGGVCAIQDNGTCTPTVVNTPEPMTLAVLGTGLIGLGLIRRRKAD